MFAGFAADGVLSGSGVNILMPDSEKKTAAFRKQTGMRRWHIDQGTEKSSPSHDPNLTFPQQKNTFML